MQYVSLSNGVKMPLLGFGVFQILIMQNANELSKTPLKWAIAQLIQQLPILMKKVLARLSGKAA